LSSKKPKQGYKLVKSLFGKYDEIPKDWDIHYLNGFVSLKHGFGFDSKDFTDNDGVKVIKIKDIQNDGTVSAENLDTVQTENLRDLKQFLVQDGDILMALTGATLGKAGIVKTDEKLLQNQRVGNIFPKNEKILDKQFLFFILRSEFVQNQIWSLVTALAQPNIGKSELEKIKFFKSDNLLEQQKIASILDNVNSMIYQTQKKIKLTQRLKKGLMQKLFTQGITHKKFKNVNLGKATLNVTIPENWKVKQLKSVITVENNSIDLKDDEFYTRIIVKRRHEGIKLRDVIEGKKILTKNQFQVLSGQFIISRRQIIHNACCIVPDSFNNSVVSNEYSIFSHSKFLLINYLDWFSQTRTFKNMIILTTHGVQIEKYVFKLKQWLKLFIPLPSIEEQQKIVSILSRTDKTIIELKSKNIGLEKLKKGLMQKLLTGQIRIKV